ncbi:MAG: YcxB family protein [Oscillospiraceae bacterium]|nr:YcxB family protein [Oscillospiraceae bacterium]
MILFNEYGIRTTSDEGYEKHFFTWDKISNVLVFKNYYIFMVSPDISIYFSKENLPVDHEDFIQNVREYVTTEKIIYGELTM